MPYKDGTSLFEGHLIRRNQKTGETLSRKQVHTRAKSKAQAERFILHKNPGYTITRLVEK